MVGVYFNPKTDYIGFHLDGVDLGVAFNCGLDSSKLVPAVVISGIASIEIIETPKEFQFKYPKSTARRKGAERL